MGAVRLPKIPVPTIDDSVSAQDADDLDVNVELPPHACAYCTIHDPACVVKCNATGKWFCNSRAIQGSYETARATDDGNMLTTERFSGTVELTLPSKTSSPWGRFCRSLLPNFAVFCGTWSAVSVAGSQSRRWWWPEQRQHIGDHGEPRPKAHLLLCAKNSRQHRPTVSQLSV